MGPVAIPLGIASLLGLGTVAANTNVDPMDALKYLSPNNLLMNDLITRLQEEDKNLITSENSEKDQKDPTPEPPKDPFTDLQDVLQIKRAVDQMREDDSPPLVDPKEYSPKMKMARPFE